MRIEKSIAAGFQKENPFKGFEIGNMSEENYDLVDLHKNVVDDIVLVSPSGQPMKREADLIDVWFDSVERCRMHNGIIRLKTKN